MWLCLLSSTQLVLVKWLCIWADMWSWKSPCLPEEALKLPWFAVSSPSLKLSVSRVGIRVRISGQSKTKNGGLPPLGWEGSLCPRKRGWRICWFCFRVLSRLSWECLGIVQEELEDVARLRDVWGTSLSHYDLDPAENGWHQRPAIGSCPVNVIKLMSVWITLKHVSCHLHFINTSQIQV